MATYESIEAAKAAGATLKDRVKFKCEKCAGTGVLPHFYHVYEGQCFDCDGLGFYTVTVATTRRWERKEEQSRAAVLAEAIEEERMRKERVEWENAHPVEMAAMRKLAEEGVSFAADVLGRETKVPSEKQIEAIMRIAAERESSTPVVEGRQVVSGRVVSVKSERDNFSYTERYVYKMLVEDDRGFRVYGSVPGNLQDAAYEEWLEDIEMDGTTVLDYGASSWTDTLKGKRVSFTATLQASQKDPAFGFFKRPTKASFEALTLV